MPNPASAMPKSKNETNAGAAKKSLTIGLGAAKAAKQDELAPSKPK
jgi:hypothetical protein